MIHVYHHHSKLPIENENLTGIKIKLNKHFFSLPEGGKVGNGGEILAKKIITDSSVMQKISSGSRQTNSNCIWSHIIVYQGRPKGNTSGT